MYFLIELIAGAEQRIFVNASIKRICSTIIQTQMSDTSSEVNYSPLPLSPAPSESSKKTHMKRAPMRKIMMRKMPA